MKHYIIILALCISAIHGYSQVLGIETIVENGPQENRINLVILPDGYTSSQQDDFINDATSLVNELFAESPYLEYASYFNVYAIKVASNESGANHPGTATDVGEPASPIKTVDNYFGSTFDYFNIHRLLVATDTNAITNVLSTHFPNYDQAMILVNDPEYGGSGGEFPTASLHFRANPIAIHELGHSFVNLKDEYWAGSFYAEEGINMTQETNPTLVRWKNWVGDNNVNIYQHSCGSCGWYKPHQNCMMEDLNDPFCSVCSEGTIEVIHELVSPIDSYSPEASSILISSSQNFQLNLVPTNTLAINWELNGTAIANNVETLTINDTDLNSGTNTLTVQVEDVSSQLRVDNHSTNHKYTITWTLQAPECSIDVYNDFDTADVTFGDNNQCTAFPFTHFYGPGNGPFPWKATIYYAAYHVLLTEDFYNDYNCDVLLNQGTGTNIWMRPHRIKTPPSGHESVMAYWNKSKHTDTNLSGVYTQIDNLEPNTTYQIEFYDLPVRTHAPGRQTANLYYNTKVSFAGQEWNGPDTYYTDDYNYWHKRTMTFTTDATTTSTTLTLQFPLHPDPNNPVNDGYIAIDDINIFCASTAPNKISSQNTLDTAFGGVTLHPNPSHGHINIKLTNTEDKIQSVTVYNTQGQLMLNKNTIAQNRLNVSQLEEGIYFVTVKTTNNKTYTKKIIKQ